MSSKPDTLLTDITTIYETLKRNLADSATALDTYIAEQDAAKAKFIEQNKAAKEAFRAKAVEDFKALLTPAPKDPPQNDRQPADQNTPQDPTQQGN